MDNKTKKQIITLVKNHHFLFPISLYGVKKALSVLGEETFYLLLELMKADALAHSDTGRDLRLKDINKI